VVGEVGGAVDVVADLVAMISRANRSMPKALTWRRLITTA